MFLPIVLTLITAPLAWYVAEDAYSASLFECFSAFTDPAISNNDRYPTKTRYRRLTRIMRSGYPIRVAFDNVKIVPVETGRYVEKSTITTNGL
jgi:hypothetical protein